MLEFLMNMLIAMVVIGIFNAVRGFLRLRKLLRKYKDDPNVEGITIINGEVKVIKKEAGQREVVKNLVRDEICHKEIEKEKAYRIVKDGQEHYFCSWECRQKFLEGDSNS